MHSALVRQDLYQGETVRCAHTLSHRVLLQIRTSYGMFIRRYQDALIAAVEERVSEWTNMPVSHQEDMQVLRYAPGQVYKPHSDANGRICTVLIYLNGAPA